MGMKKIEKLSSLTSKKDRLAVSAVEVKTDAFPMLLPHRVTARVLMSYLDPKTADAAEEKIRYILKGTKLKTRLETISVRPPMKERRTNKRLAKSLAAVAEEWEIPLPQESSLWPSIAGLVPAKIPVVCGLGPAARDLYTPQEAVNRTSLIQRSLLIAQFILKDIRR
jgi:D-alanine-D-alanine ligase